MNSYGGGSCTVQFQPSAPPDPSTVCHLSRCLSCLKAILIQGKERDCMDCIKRHREQQEQEAMDCAALRTLRATAKYGVPAKRRRRHDYMREYKGVQ